MKLTILGKCSALLLLLPTMNYATVDPDMQTRSIFSMFSKSSEILGKTRKILKGSNETTPSILTAIDAIQKTLAATDHSAELSTTTLIALLKCYIEIMQTTMLMSCKEFDLLDQVGSDLVATFDSTVPGQLSTRHKNAKVIAASLEKLSKRIIELLPE